MVVGRWSHWGSEVGRPGSGLAAANPGQLSRIRSLSKRQTEASPVRSSHTQTSDVLRGPLQTLGRIDTGGEGWKGGKCCWVLGRGQPRGEMRTEVGHTAHNHSVPDTTTQPTHLNLGKRCRAVPDCGAVFVFESSLAAGFSGGTWRRCEMRPPLDSATRRRPIEQTRWTSCGHTTYDDEPSCRTLTPMGQFGTGPINSRLSPFAL